MLFNKLIAQSIMKQISHIFDQNTENSRVTQKEERNLNFQKFKKTNFNKAKMQFQMAEVKANFHTGCGKIMSKQKRGIEKLRKIQNL